ncbi:hypothetical protein BRADI_5g22980v3 [Brachypodium distachyon]|uniref:non-specific serine/threonine protein kinase n=1 Tax=Brachypodium distachyon TaxID=15368 RepID=A0A2K2CIQ9_BRADI|nr:hypothetical protein BRADI_5g22980v3 [Brachypodium distachyon]
MMDMSYFPIFILLFLFSFCKSDDSLTQGKPLYPGNMLVSKGGIFALGFFSPTNSNRGLYVGIWFYNIREPNRTIVWVANRDNSATSTSPATLTISNKSDLVLSDSRGRTLWMTKNNITAEEGANASAILLDTGNLVLSLPNGTIIWQSFDHPTDTIMPGMKFLLSYKDHVVGRLIAWKGPYDPSVGEFSFSLDPSSKMQIVTWHGTKLYCRMKVWNGASVSGGTYPGNTSSVVYQTIVNTGDKFYLMYTVSDGSPYARIMLDYTGTMRLLTWNSHTSSWVATSERPTGGYGVYGSCGTFGYSDFTGAVPTCQCLDGFKSNSLNSSSGCQRVEVLKCGKQNHFVALPRMKVPDKFLRIQNRSFDQCAAECSRNCSCTAYAYANLSSSSTMADQTRCLIWTGELVDTWKVNNYGENLYIRLANPSGAHDKSNLLKIVLSVLTCLLLLMCIALAWRCKYRVKRRKKEIQKKLMLGCLSSSSELVGENLEALFVSFEDIVVATDNFSDSNMLGRGGFGKVYKTRAAPIEEVEEVDALDDQTRDFDLPSSISNRGYMSPEYVMIGSFSVKSDTYSFGVLLLEIVSGLKISSPQLIMNFPNLTAYAWRLWEDGNARCLVDSSINENCPIHEVLRCIQISFESACSFSTEGSKSARTSVLARPFQEKKNLSKKSTCKDCKISGQ